MLRDWISNRRNVTLLAALLFGVFAIAFFLEGDGKMDVRSAMLAGDYQSAFDSAVTAANEGDLVSQNTVGNLYYIGLGVPQNFDRASRWYARAAFAGHGPSQANLAHLFCQGLGVEKDLVRCLGWLKLAQRSGHGEVEDLLKRKTRENQYNASMIASANEAFVSMSAVKKQFEDDFAYIDK